MITQGKWELKDGKNNLYRRTIENDDGCFEARMQYNFTIYGPDPNSSQFIADVIVKSSPEGIANALLMVAAPKLLEACKKAETYLFHYISKLNEFGVYGDGVPLEKTNAAKKIEFLTNVIARVEE